MERPGVSVFDVCRKYERYSTAMTRRGLYLSVVSPGLQLPTRPVTVPTIPHLLFFYTSGKLLLTNLSTFLLTKGKCVSRFFKSIHVLVTDKTRTETDSTKPLGRRATAGRVCRHRSHWYTSDRRPFNRSTGPEDPCNWIRSLPLIHHESGVEGKSVDPICSD